MSLESVLQGKRVLLRESLARLGKVAVAFSGGVDSSFLLWTAADVLGGAGVVAVHAHTCLHKKKELSSAATFAGECGCRFLKVEIDPLAWPEFIANPADRCYICKKNMYGLILDAVGGQDLTLIDGTNLDDLAADRPGLCALREHGVRIPLADAGLAKADVRELSRQAILSCWNKPSSSCLATRIPAGTPIERSLLEQIDKAEEFLENLGFLGCRVRPDGKMAAIAVATSQVASLAREEMREKIVSFFTLCGFGRIVLDLEGRPESDFTGLRQ